MKTLIVLSTATVMAMSTSAFAGGGLFANVPVFSPNVAIGTGDINLLSGNVLAVANGSAILNGLANGIGNNNGVLNNFGVLTGIGNLTNGMTGLHGKKH